MSKKRRAPTPVESADERARWERAVRIARGEIEPTTPYERTIYVVSRLADSATFPGENEPLLTARIDDLDTADSAMLASLIRAMLDVLEPMLGEMERGKDAQLYARLIEQRRSANKLLADRGRCTPRRG
jgi:hypothetical protein